VEIEGLVVEVLQVVVAVEQLAELAFHAALGFLLVDQVHCHLQKNLINIFLHEMPVQLAPH
jgi:predicted GNAT superfamily acetyltransferase